MIIAKKLKTDSTNSNSQVNYRYDSTGAGDVVFGATFNDENSSNIRFEEDSSFLIQTYSIEDCDYANMNEQIKTSSSSTGIETELVSSLDLPTNFEYSFDMKGNTNFAVLLRPTTDSKSLNGFTDSNIVFIQASTSGSSIVRSNVGNLSTTTYYSYKYIVEGTNVRMFVNDVEYTSATGCSWLSDYTVFKLAYSTWASGTFYIKNLKVKPL